MAKQFYKIDPCLTDTSFAKSGNTKGGSITVPLTSCLTGLDQSVFANKNKNCQ